MSITRPEWIFFVPLLLIISKGASKPGGEGLEPLERSRACAARGMMELMVRVRVHRPVTDADDWMVIGWGEFGDWMVIDG